MLLGGANSSRDILKKQAPASVVKHTLAARASCFKMKRKSKPPKRLIEGNKEERE